MTEKKLSQQQRFKAVIDWFEKNVPVAETELHYSNPYELLVAVILSAQCTDKRVNMITPAFFLKYPDVKTLAEGTEEEVFNLIRSCSYPNNKTKHLLGAARKLINEFGGEVPDSTDKLQSLPGVGRKTANVIASVAFEIPALAVDTHVHRVAARLGLTINAKTPLATEEQLLKYIPKNKLNIAHHWFILHGRYICIARKPKCGDCGLRQVCKFYQNMNTIRVGEKLPEINTIDHNGNPVNNETLKGKKTVIYFYPKDMTPGCTAQACNIRDNYEVLLKNNYNVIGISPDDMNSHKKFAEKYNLPFPLISDTDKELAKLFGVWGPKKFMGKTYDGVHRTTFVTNEELVVVEIIEKVDTKNHASQIIK